LYTITSINSRAKFLENFVLCKYIVSATPENATKTTGFIIFLDEQLRMIVHAYTQRSFVEERNLYSAKEILNGRAIHLIHLTINVI